MEGLKRVREDVFRVRYFENEKPSICPYDIDFVDKDEMVERLAGAGREYVKRGLCVLSSDFMGLFESAPAFKNTKEENKYFLDLLKSKVNLLYDIDLEGVIGQRNDEIFLECERLEKEVKQPIYSKYLIEYGEKLRNELNEKAAYDVVGEIETYRQNMISMCQSIIEQTEVYYISNIDRVRKAEQRNRDLLFCKIMQGLSFFYDNDCPVYEGTDTPAFSNLRSKYSIIDILAIRAGLGLEYDRYDIDSAASYFHCLEAFDRNIEEFSDSGYFSYFERVLNM